MVYYLAVKKTNYEVEAIDTAEPAEGQYKDNLYYAYVVVQEEHPLLNEPCPANAILLSDYKSHDDKVTAKMAAVKAVFAIDGVETCADMLGKHEVLVVEYYALKEGFVDSDT